MILSDADCAAIAERVQKATPGPWHRRPDDAIVRAGRSRTGWTDHLLVMTSTIPIADCVFRDGSTKLHDNEIQNAECIAHAPTDLANLLATIAALREALETYGTHTEECRVHLAVRAMRGTGIDVSCDCGLDAALRPGGSDA